MGNAMYICSKCGWKVRLNMLFDLNKWLPLCSVCEGTMDGFRIIDKGLE